MEEEMATHSSILAWKIPWTEEPVSYHPWGHKESDMTEPLSMLIPICILLFELAKLNFLHEEVCVS